MVDNFHRGLFIIDPNGVVRQVTINDLPVGRSVEETLRLVKAFQFVEKHGEGLLKSDLLFMYLFSVYFIAIPLYLCTGFMLGLYFDVSLLLRSSCGLMVNTTDLCPANLSTAADSGTHMSHWWQQEGYLAKISPVSTINSPICLDMHVRLSR